MELGTFASNLFPMLGLGLAQGHSTRASSEGWYHYKWEDEFEMNFSMIVGTFRMFNNTYPLLGSQWIPLDFVPHQHPLDCSLRHQIYLPFPNWWTPFCLLNSDMNVVYNTKTKNEKKIEFMTLWKNIFFIYIREFLFHKNICSHWEHGQCERSHTDR